MSESVRSSRFRFTIHDRYQAELKFSHELDPAQPRGQIFVEAFFLFPPSLDVQSATYPKEAFYQDLVAHTRYGTPVLSLAQLLDPAEDRSPLNVLDKLRPQLAAAGDPQAAKAAVYELRLLGCIFRARLREGLRDALARLEREAPGAADWEAAERISTELFKFAGRILARVRELNRACREAPAGAEVLKVLEWVDEALSLQWEGIAGKLARTFQEAAHKKNCGAQDEGAASWARRLAEAMREEETYRRSTGYPARISAAHTPAAREGNEAFITRAGHLKRFLQSVLFLSVRTRPAGQRLQQLFFGLAAGAAMLAVLLVTWLLSEVFLLSSVPALLLGILVYAFKDRFKDWLKGYFHAKLTGWLRDREHLLKDRKGPAVVGFAREGCSFVDFADLPPEVRAGHCRDELEARAEEDAPPTVIRYQKNLRFYTDRIFRMHRRVNAVDEIMRFSIRRFLTHMDDPQKILLAASASGAARDDRTPHAAGIPAHKVYVVELVLRLAASGTSSPAAQLERFRLILTRDGILRAETGRRERLNLTLTFAP